MPGADNLKLIHGIGPAAEHRLRGVGVGTFAQLAALSAADIAAAVADLPGLSAERITKQDWIGQARRLAMTSVEEEETRQEADEDTAEAEHALEHVPEEALRNEEVLESIPEEIAPVMQSGPQGVFYLSDLEIVAPDEYRRHAMLASGQPFELALTLDLTHVVASSDSPLTYSASIHGTSLGGDRSRVLVGHAQGSIPSLDSTTIKVQGTALSQGFYRLEAIVILSQASEGHKQSPGLVAQLESRLLQCL